MGNKAALVSSASSKNPAEEGRGDRAHSRQGEDKSGARLNCFAALEQADAFEQCSEQNQRNRKMNNERMEAADELAEVASLNTVRRSIQGGGQQNQNDEQADTAEDPGASVHPASSDTTQASDAPDRQPLGYEDVATLEKDCRMRSDELARREFAAGLLAPRADFSIHSFAVTELRDDLVLAIENADLAVQVGANHPLALRIEVARHAQARIIFDRAEMFPAKIESLHTAVSAISNYEHGILSAQVHKQAVRSIKFAVTVPRTTDLAEEFSG